MLLRLLTNKKTKTALAIAGVAIAALSIAQIAAGNKKKRFKPKKTK